MFLSRFRMCLTKLEEYRRASQLVKARRHSEAQQYFGRCLDIVRNVPANSQIQRMYIEALDNKIKLKKYQEAIKLNEETAAKFTEYTAESQLTGYLLARVSNLSGSQYDVSSGIKEAIDGIIGEQTKEIREVKPSTAREVIIVALGQHLSSQNADLKHILSHLSKDSKISLDSVTSEQKNALEKSSTSSDIRLLYCLCYILLDSPNTNNKTLSLWLNIFLKACENTAPDQLHRALYLLAVFYCNNGKNMVGQGLINTALDKIDKEAYPDEYGMIVNRKAKIVAQNEKRIEEAEQMMKDGKFQTKNIYLSMIL